MYRGFDLWVALVEPYLSDAADPGLPAHWKRQIEDLDRENKQRRKDGKPERVALTFTRRLLEREQVAVKELARMFRSEDLYVVFPKRMSEREAEAGESRDAAIYASYQRYRVGPPGSRHEQAVEMTAREFETSTDRVEVVIEFRRDTTEDECSEAGCDRAPYQGGMCVRHYTQDYRARKKQERSA